MLWHWALSVTHRTADGHLTMPNPLDTVPGAPVLTWLLQVMPLFFVVGGYANFTAWQGIRRAGGGAGTFLRRRLARLTRPLLPLVAAWAVLDGLGLLLVPGYETALRWASVVFVPLWFLAAYLPVVALVPLTARWHDRAGGAGVAVLGAAAIGLDLVRVYADAPAFAPLSTALVWLFAHQVGYLWRDGTAAAWGTRGALLLVACALAGLTMLTTVGPYSASMVALRTEQVSNMLPTSAPIALVAVLQMGCALLARPAIERWAARPRPARAVHVVNSAATTVFGWHMTALVVVVLAWERVVGPLGSTPDAAWWLTRPVWVVAPLVVLLPIAAAVARWERPAAPGR